jgi:putative Holliday junction resolvase
MIFYDLLKFNTLLVNGKPLIAIDYGDQSSGFAVSDPNRKAAVPLHNIETADFSRQVSSSIEMLDRYDACGLVLGLALMPNGRACEQGSKAESFANRLLSIRDIAIYMQDERFTSITADRLLKSAGIRRKERSKREDALSACLILESVLSGLSLLNA